MGSAPPPPPPPLSLERLARLFGARYASHFLLPSAIVFALVALSPSDELALVALVVSSALWVSAAQRALSGGRLFTELGVRRAALRALMLAATLVLTLVLYCAPLAFVLLLLALWLGFDRHSAGVFVTPALLAATYLVGLRLWPVYVVQYLFRGSEADLWGRAWHIKLPDIGIAWRLTAVPGSLWRASVPATLAGLAGLTLFLLLTDDRALSRPVLLSLELLAYFLLFPFLHLLVVERGWVLAFSSEPAVARALRVAESGFFWFAGLSERGEEDAELDALLRYLHRLRRGVGHGPPDAPRALTAEERARLAARCQPVLERERPLEAARMRRLAEGSGGGEGERLTCDHLALAAAELVSRRTPSLDPYEARRRVAALYRERYPGERLELAPEERLVWVGEALSAPQVPNKYAPLLRLTARDPYWEDPRYRELLAQGARMSDGAILALLPLMHIGLTRASRAFENDPVPPTLVGELVESLHERAYRAMVEYLRHPFEYHPGLAGPVGPGPFFAVIVQWPRPFAEPLFRSAFASGWNGVASLLYALSWGPDLVAEFADSPYGAPMLR